MKTARYFIRRLPFFLLLLKGLWVALLSAGFSIAPYWYLSEIQGHSLAFVAVLAYYAYVGRHCAYLWACIFALFSLNALNIAYYFFNFSYFYSYAGAIITGGLTFSFIYAIRRLRRDNKKP